MITENFDYSHTIIIVRIYFNEICNYALGIYTWMNAFITANVKNMAYKEAGTW